MLFLFGWAVFIGEIVPVWIQTLEGIAPGDPGAKESMFASWDMFIPTVILYSLLAIVFWYLYRRLYWIWVLVLAASLGTVLEFFVFRPQESQGPNVAEDPVGALLFFLIIWPILLGVPYGLFQWVSSKMSGYGKR